MSENVKQRINGVEHEIGPNADLRDADLSGANLSGANLSGADLSFADLLGANLRGANLSGANLSKAYLRRTDLSGANLRDTSLSSANLSSANLSGAYLSDEYDIPIIENIEQVLHNTINADNLKMETWHAGDTTNCIGGWIVTLAGNEGKALENEIFTNAAAALIYAKSSKSGIVPDFYASSEDALKALKVAAEAEVAE